MTNKSRIIDNIIVKFFYWLPDKTFLNIRYRLNTGKKLSLKRPKTYNEKLQWLKLYDRKPEYTKMVDKYEVKHLVSMIIGSQYVVPTIGVWDSVEDIEWDSLPNQFVLKTTHGGGGNGVVICRDKESFDKESAIDKLQRSMKSDIYRNFREWPYKDVKKRIIAEPLLCDDNAVDGGLIDYKFYCFNGEPKLLFVATGRTEMSTCADYFDMDFNKLDIIWGYPHSNELIKKPTQFEKMKVLAAALSRGVPELRVDFYEVNGKVFFGELTFFDGSGFAKIVPEEWDVKLGDWIILNQY